ncbi:hypothetical protein EDB82DRAFT_493867 [Fusarium venenatum]|uniref:uncharacterized protein n=1 Tax=Fusarium venenatum TaxID=56646 RepID=UPI001DEACB84|nr:hypothetical protein EDB82DRAFT_493867 [Fusarium venenatum]
MTENSRAHPLGGPNSSRATRACLVCRSRKVRCDVSLRGLPCTNCSLDAKECHVAERKSRQQLPCLDKASVPAGSQQRFTATAQADQATQSFNIAQPQQDNFDIRSDYSTFEHTITDSSSTHTFDNIHTSQKSTGRNTESPRPSAESHVCYQDFRQYGFVKLNNIDSLSAQDLGYLQAQRCFHLPVKLLLDELIRLYLFHVHPMLPILDEQSFWASYFEVKDGSDGCNNQIPLLLLWSALVASSGFLSPTSAISLGYSDVRNARAGFYQKAKILFDVGSESSSVVLGQSALLLSFQTFSPSFQTSGVSSIFMGSNTIWLRTAVRHAQLANAETICCSPLVSTTSSGMAGSTILIRLWWCCIILDRVIALGQRRDLLIPKDYPIPRYSWFEDDLPWSRAQMMGIKRHFNVHFMHSLKLCAIVKGILTLDSRPQQLKNKTLSQLKESMEILEESRHSLKQWHRVAMLDIPELGDNQNSHTSLQHPPLAAFTRMLRIGFSAAKMCAGHRELLLSTSIPATGDETLAALVNVSRAGQEIQGAILEISDCVIEFIQLGLIPHLYVGVAACAALPYLMQVLDLKIFRHSSPEAKLTDQYHRLRLLTGAVKEYQTRYGGMELFGSAIQFIITNFQLFTQPMSESVTYSSWQDVLVHDPSLYMRLVLTLEHCTTTATIPTVQQLATTFEGILTMPTRQYSGFKQIDDEAPQGN